MTLNIRLYREEDHDAIIELSLLAWEPVFRSFEQVLGHNVYDLLYPDWQAIQAKVVESVFEEPEKFTILVAEVDGVVAGVLPYTLDYEEKKGTVYLLAVHPAYQNHGIGAALNRAALEGMKACGMKLASVDTGGDPGHAPARRCYEKAGFDTSISSVHYFKDFTES